MNNFREKSRPTQERLEENLPKAQRVGAPKGKMDENEHNRKLLGPFVPEEGKEQSKAFYWQCHHCGKRLEDNDEAMFIYETFMSGNTPVHHKGTAFHKQCYRNFFDERGNWLFRR